MTLRSRPLLGLVLMLLFTPQAWAQDFEVLELPAAARDGIHDADFKPFLERQQTKSVVTFGWIGTVASTGVAVLTSVLYNLAFQQKGFVVPLVAGGAMGAFMTWAGTTAYPREPLPGKVWYHTPSGTVINYAVADDLRRQEPALSDLWEVAAAYGAVTVLTGGTWTREEWQGSLVGPDLLMKVPLAASGTISHRYYRFSSQGEDDLTLVRLTAQEYADAGGAP